MDVYLLIHEDGNIEQVTEFKEDFKDSVDAGILTVVFFNKDMNNFEDLQPDGSWLKF